LTALLMVGSTRYYRMRMEPLNAPYLFAQSLVFVVIGTIKTESHRYIGGIFSTGLQARRVGLRSIFIGCTVYRYVLFLISLTKPLCSAYTPRQCNLIPIATECETLRESVSKPLHPFLSYSHHSGTLPIDVHWYSCQ